MAPEAKEDRLLDGRVRLRQPARGYRAGMDAALLAAACDARPGQRAAICINTAPAPLPASITRWPGLASTAAASRAASIPAR